MRKRTKENWRRLQPRRELNIRHVLVPLDFSGMSRQALTCAVPLARKHRAKISLIHVVYSPVEMLTEPGGGVALPVNTMELVRAAWHHLEKLAGQLLPDDVRGRLIVREGSPAFEAVAAAKSVKADLLVLSTTGRSGLSRILLGSTAERIVRHAPCPVLTVRRRRAAGRIISTKPDYPKQLAWKEVLVPLDFSLTSLRALQTAVPLARQCRARLLLLNVIEPNPYPTGMEGAVLIRPDVEILRHAKGRLPAIASHFIPKSIPVTSLVQRGRAADTIVTTAEKKNVDLIVLSTHGHTGLDRLLMGSTAEQVVRHAKCPVLVIRAAKG